MKRMAAAVTVGALAAAATGQECLVRTLEVEIDLLQVGPGRAEVSVPFDPSVSALSGWIMPEVLELVQLKGPGGQVSSVVDGSLFASGAVVGDLVGSFGLSEQVARSGAVFSWPARWAATPAPAIDEMRLSLDVALLFGAPSGEARLSGLHGQTQVKLHVLPGEGFYPEGRGPHGVIAFLDEPSMLLTETGVTAWRELPLDNLPMTEARLIFFGPFGLSGTTFPNNASVTVEAHVVLDDGSVIILDDTESPSMGAARPAIENASNATTILAIDETTRAALAGRSAVGVRYRVHSVFDGPGSLTFTAPGGGMPLWLVVARCDWLCYADADESGTIDFFDFLAFQNEFAAGASAADCDNSGSLDFFDFLCFQNEFAGGCP